jgi:hypothetical protein
MRKPNFLFIGPDKTGSSWLYEVLRQHTACFVPPAKDIYFFDRYYERGWDWYAAHFADAGPDCKAVGELSHDYLFSPLAARRIADDLPEVKLITILREPADRAFSHYLYMIRSGRTRLPFERALQDFPEIVNNSSYGRHLTPYFELFGRDRLGVFYFDDLKQSPETLARRILAFLSLDWTDGIDCNQQVRAAAAPRSFALAGLAKQGANAARALGLANLVGTIKNSRVAQLLYKPYDQESRPRVELATAARLEEVFAEDLALLKPLLPKPRPGWLE